MELNNKRNSFIDFIKGISIFLVMWGHCIQYVAGGSGFWYNPIFKTIYTFHMPLFMLMSGYLFYYSCNNKTYIQIIISKIKSLVVPIISCAVISGLLVSIQNNQFDIVNIIKNIYSHKGNLWFVYSVLMASIVVGFIQCYIKNKAIRNILFVLGIAIVALFHAYALNVFMYPYFVIGFISNEINITKKSCCRYIELISIVIWIIMAIFYKHEHYIYESGINPFTSKYGFIIK